MKTSSKKLVSLLICLAMVLAILPFSVFAETYQVEPNSYNQFVLEPGQSVTIEVDATDADVDLVFNGNRMYYDWYVDTGRMQNYPNPVGVVEMTLPAGSTYTLQLVNVSADAEQVVELTASVPVVGTEQNPDQLVMGTNVGVCAEWSAYVYGWTAEQDGYLTIDVDVDASTEWSFSLYGELANGEYYYGDTYYSDVEPVVDTQTVAVSAGDYFVIMVAGANFEAATVVFDASFSTEAPEGMPEGGDDEDVPTDEEVTYVISDVMLSLGENYLELDPTVDYTIFEFWPEETGVYKFTADDYDALVGYWGAGTFYVNDFTPFKTYYIEESIGEVGPSIMVGICAEGPVVLTVEKTEDFEIVEIPRVNYENQHEFIFFEADEDASYGSFNLMDSQREEIFECEYGFLHYGSVDGPLLVADLSEFPVSISGASELGGLTAIVDVDGETVKVDYNEAMMEYYDMGLYPVTAELATMLQLVGESKGWWEGNGFVFTGNGPAYPEDGWLYACYYLDADEYYIELPEIETPDEPTVPSEPVDPEDPADPTVPSAPEKPTTPSKPVDPDDEEFEEIPVTSDRSVLGLAVALGVAASALVVLKKKED